LYIRRVIDTFYESRADYEVGREIIHGYSTSDRVTKIMTLSEKLGKKTPTRSQRLWICCQQIIMPMINESIETLAWCGWRSEIDHRYETRNGAPMGPLQLADFIGLDVCHSIILNVMYDI
jgi:3-hydroxybutyryl-CoA dehydrogenase